MNDGPIKTPFGGSSEESIRFVYTERAGATAWAVFAQYADDVPLATGWAHTFMEARDEAMSRGLATVQRWLNVSIPPVVASPGGEAEK